MYQPPTLGRYSLIRRVGAGGFATVWLAYDDQLDAEVAIKILSDNWIDADDVRRRFIAEGRFLRRVNSPYVVGVHDIGETEDGRPYLVLSYADGGSLAERIKGGPLEIASVIEMVDQVGTGLQQLHERGVLHRDVKPANVLFRSETDGERAMLGDLGLGKSLENVSQLTMPGGTPAYVAPEQVLGDRLDERADLYSLGAVTYAALTGQTPHGVNSLGAVLQIDSPPPPMSTLREDVPAAVDAVVRRALEPDRERRWPTVESFLTALRDAYETGKSPRARRGSARRWVVAVLLAAILGGAGGYGGYWFMSRRPVEVSDQTGAVSVRVPRSWAAEVANGTTEQPALLVSRNIVEWRLPESDTPGVFAGVVPGRLPTAAPAPGGCASRRPASADRVSGKAARTEEFVDCPGSTVVFVRYIELSDRQSLQIQVRASSSTQARKVLDSVIYRGG